MQILKEIDRNNVYRPIQDAIVEEIDYYVWAKLQDKIWFNTNQIIRNLAINTNFRFR